MRKNTIKAILTAGMVFGLALCTPVEVSAEESYIRKEYQGYASEIAEDYGLDPSLVIAIIESESSGRRKVVSSAGCVGLMQISPKWHTDRMERLGVEDLEDAYGNILVGCDYLSELCGKYDDVYTVLMCYNEGEYSGAVEKAEQGKHSKYAEKIVARSKELKEEKDAGNE